MKIILTDAIRSILRKDLVGKVGTISGNVLKHFSFNPNGKYVIKDVEFDFFEETITTYDGDDYYNYEIPTYAISLKLLQWRLASQHKELDMN